RGVCFVEIIPPESYAARVVTIHVMVDRRQYISPFASPLLSPLALRMLLLPPEMRKGGGLIGGRYGAKDSEVRVIYSHQRECVPHAGTGREGGLVDLPRRCSRGRKREVPGGESVGLQYYYF